jgi:SAM-dependent methyltransferase
LHVAPEEQLRRVLIDMPHLQYVTVDLHTPFVGLRLDIQRIPCEYDFFDGIICNHVLEHVSNDRQALRELYRVLKPGGWAILQVPIAAAFAETREFKGPLTPEQRQSLYGQADHVRLYGRDYPGRLAHCGFVVHRENAVQILGGEVVRRYGLNKEEDIYFVWKKPK